MFSYQHQVYTGVLENSCSDSWHPVTGHGLLLWDGSLWTFFWVTGTICPPCWGKAGWSEWSPGTPFSFWFGIPELVSVVGWWGGWFRVTCFVLCPAANPRHNLLWITCYIAEDMFCCKADSYKMIGFAISSSHGARCLLAFHPCLFRSLIFFWMHNKN